MRRITSAQRGRDATVTSKADLRSDAIVGCPRASVADSCGRSLPRWLSGDLRYWTRSRMAARQLDSRRTSGPQPATRARRRSLLMLMCGCHRRRRSSQRTRSRPRGWSAAAWSERSPWSDLAAQAGASLREPMRQHEVALLARAADSHPLVLLDERRLRTAHAMLGCRQPHRLQTRVLLVVLCGLVSAHYWAARLACRGVARRGGVALLLIH